MSLFKEIKGNFNVFLAILGISSFFQFAFKEAFMYPSVLPLNVPYESLLEELGNVFFYLYFLSMTFVSFLLGNKYRVMYLVGFSLVASFLASFVPGYNLSPLWYYFEVFIGVIGIALVLESLLKSSIRSLLLVPSALLVVVGIVASISLNVYHQALFANYLALYLASLVGFLLYLVIWRKIKSVRSYAGLGVFLLVLVPFLFLEKQIAENRYMEMLMDMILPSVLGIDLYNPFQIVYLVFAMGMSFALVFMALVKGNYAAGIGYLMLFSTVFLGIEGYLLVVYMLSPVVGFGLMTYADEGKPLWYLARGKLVQRVKDKSSQ
ncbi:MAG: cytochrome b558/566 subunit B [Candidatus Aramenus sp.]|nr:cytochrome b558/566 subunit B [Candidatus Aramenus sp.]